MKIYLLFLLSLISFALCSDIKKIEDFVKCANKNIGVLFREEENKPPFKFTDPGLVSYCRGQAGLDNSGPFYAPEKDVKAPKVGALVFGITKTIKGSSVAYDYLGIIVSINSINVVSGNKNYGVFTRKSLKFEKEYIRVEYIYVDS